MAAVGQARERVEHVSPMHLACHAAAIGFSSAIASRSSAVTMLSSMPVAKNDQTSSGDAPDSRATSATTLAVLAADVLLDLRVGDRGVALHQHQQGVAVGQQLVDVRLAHRVSFSPGAAVAAARRKASSTFPHARSSQARNSSFLVRKSRNRYGCEIPASRAITSVDVPW